MVLPPTWGHGLTLEFEPSQADRSSVPTVTYNSAPLLDTPTIITRPRAAPRYLAFESTEEARRASIERLKNKVAELAVNSPEDASDVERDQIRLAAQIVVKLIAEMPRNLPLPKVMPLSCQISLYWDFGETYGEIAVSGNGQLSLYGRQPGKNDILVDTSFTELRASGLTFPIDLDKILIAS
jgi:hypothetical protein